MQISGTQTLEQKLGSQNLHVSSDATQWQVTSLETPRLTRPEDALETAECIEELQAAQEYALTVATEPLARLCLGWQPPSKAAVSTRTLLSVT